MHAEAEADCTLISWLHTFKLSKSLLACACVWLHYLSRPGRKAMSVADIAHVDIETADTVRLAWREGNTALRGEDASETAASTSTDVAPVNDAGFMVHKVGMQNSRGAGDGNLPTDPSNAACRSRSLTR